MRSKHIMLVDYDKHDLGVSMFEIMIKIQRMYLRRILSETLQFFLLCNPFWKRTHGKI